MKKTRRTPSEGIDMISRYQTSGLSVSEFCQMEGISQAGFYLWKKRYSSSRGKESSGKAQFYPVSISDIHSDLISGLSVHYPNGIELRIDSGVSIQAIRQLIRLYR
jgi:hypothetical protein